MPVQKFAVRLDAGDQAEREVDAAQKAARFDADARPKRSLSGAA